MGWAPNIAVSVAPAGVRPWLPGPSLHSTYNRPSLNARATHQCVQFSRETWRSVPRPSANAVVRPRTPTTLMRHLRRLSTLLSGYICMDLLSVEEPLRWKEYLESRSWFRQGIPLLLVITRRQAPSAETPRVWRGLGYDERMFVPASLGSSLLPELVS